MQAVRLVAPEGKWRVVELPTGEFHTQQRRFIIDCKYERTACFIADLHNADVDSRHAYTVFNAKGEAVHGPGCLIPFVKSVLCTSRGSPQQVSQLEDA
jgi:hypothetical protein